MLDWVLASGVEGVMACQPVGKDLALGLTEAWLQVPPAQGLGEHGEMHGEPLIRCLRAKGVLCP